MGRKSNSTGREGFTLIEAISTLAILAIVMTAMLVVLKPQMQILKAKDSQRKADLNMISKALEDYLNDNPCYPDASVFADCGGVGFRPYLSKIPCDPVTKLPYLYERPECKMYVISVALSTQESYVVSSQNFLTPSPSPGAIVGYGCFFGACRPMAKLDCFPSYDMPDCRGKCEDPVNACQ